MTTEAEKRRDEIFVHLAKDFETATKLGYTVLGVFLQGSQNYHLDYAGSDIDTKAIIIPTLEDIVLNRQPVSTTHINEDNSHLDLKDIRLMWQCFKKQNINFLEILFTDYYIVNSEYFNQWERMREMAEKIAHYNNYAAVNCIAGMVFEKQAALCHPYPTLKHKIDRYGYDNKQLHHIVRCEEFLRRYIDGVPYAECLIPTDPKYLIQLKSEYWMDVEKAKAYAQTMVEEVKRIKQKYMDEHPVQINKEAEEFLQDMLVEVITLSLKKELWDSRKDLE